MDTAPSAHAPTDAAPVTPVGVAEAATATVTVVGVPADDNIGATPTAAAATDAPSTADASLPREAAAVAVGETLGQVRAH
jgi:hypothetical protein